MGELAEVVWRDLYTDGFLDGFLLASAFWYGAIGLWIIGGAVVGWWLGGEVEAPRPAEIERDVWDLPRGMTVPSAMPAMKPGRVGELERWTPGL